MRKAYKIASNGINALTFAVVLCFSVLVSCQENRVDEVNPLDQEIAVAKEYYSKSQTRLEAKFGDRYILSPDWKGAYLEDIGGGNVLLHAVLGKDIKNNGILELVFADGDADDLPTQIVEYLADKGTSREDKAFNGFINFYDKLGRFQTGGWFADGVFRMVRIPEAELANLTDKSLRVNFPEEGIDLAEVTIIGHRPETPNQYVYINIPVSFFSPYGGSYNGYNYGPAGGSGPAGSSGSEGTANNYPAFNTYGNVKPTSFTFTDLSSSMKKAINRVGLQAVNANKEVKTIYFNIQTNVPSGPYGTPMMQSMAAHAATYATREVMRTATITFFQAGSEAAVANQWRSFMQIHLQTTEQCGGCQVTSYPNGSPATPLDWSN